MRYILIILTILAFPITAQAQSQESDLDGFEQLGTITASINGTPVVFPLGIVSEQRASTSVIYLERGQPVLRIGGGTFDTTGRYDLPTLNFRLPLEGGIPGEYALITYFGRLGTETDPGLFAVAGSVMGGLVFSEFTLTDSGQVSFGFTASLVEVDGDWEPIPGKSPIVIIGQVAALIPPAFDGRQ